MMLNHAIFKKNLNTHNINAEHLLLKLGDLLGCVFLEDNHHPVIAFLPKKYVIFQTNVAKFYQRQNYNEYLESKSEQNLNHFIKINHNNINTSTSAGFQGGYIGFIDYNFPAQKNINTTFRSQPNLFIGEYLSYLKYSDGIWTYYSYDNTPEVLFEIIQSKVSAQHTQNKHFKLKQKCQAQWSKKKYNQAFNKIQDYIKSGDCYQINLTQEFKTKVQGSLLHIAQDFWQLTNAPYSGYLKINDFELLSCSPELFIEFMSHKKIITKPIKGTMPRYHDPILDEQSKQKLIHSEKDQAENLMIVDLLRNDLSVYAEIGSVKTPKLFTIESFNQVHHMVSEVTATLKDNIHPFEMLISALPGGSITGAPKIRAMQIIEELENAPRGAYCGTLGYFNFDGTGSWNILIRSIQKYKDDVSLSAGGGITISSDCDAEYQECFDKISALIDLLNTWYHPEKAQQ